MVLLTRRKNSKARNFDFDKKKQSYFQTSSGVTSFAITSQVIQIDEWTPDVVDTRQQKLIRLLTEAWGLDKITAEPDPADVNFYIKTMNGIEAKGYPTTSGFMIMKGAKCSIETTDSVSRGILKTRQSLLEKNILKEQGEYLQLMENYEFSSPSQALSVVLSRSSNGLTTWIRSNGKTLKEHQNG